MTLRPIFAAALAAALAVSPALPQAVPAPDSGRGGAAPAEVRSPARTPPGPRAGSTAAAVTTWLRLGTAGVLAVGGVLCLGLFIGAVRRDDLRVESHWGGFGGGVGGWRVPSSLVFLAAALAFSALLAMVASAPSAADIRAARPDSAAAKR